MNLLLSSLAVVAFVVLVLLLLALLVLMVYRRRRSNVSRNAVGQQAHGMGGHAGADGKDVQFRMQGERGAGGPVYGDVLCGDGVYLPKVWESDYHTSFDGRWIRTGAYGGGTPCLIDRKSLRSWNLTTAEVSALDSVHWRLPRWSEVSANRQRQMEDGQQVFTDAAFDEWLKDNVEGAAQALVAVRDLWVPADQVPSEDGQQAPALTQPDETPVKLSMQRHWPASLRTQRRPLEPVLRPRWKLLFGETPQPWAVDEHTELVWREDGQAFAFYGTSAADSEQIPDTALIVWSAQHGWLHWDAPAPADRKSWRIGISVAGDASVTKSVVPVLRWDGDTLLQRMEVDIPELERLHDGQQIHSAMDGVDGCVTHSRDGRVRLQKIPRTMFLWRRHLAKPELWQAYSAPVAGKPLCWTLVKEAADETGATPAYQLEWGESRLSGLWELEHVVVQGRWAVLLQHGASPLRGEKNTVQIWDGAQLQTLSLPWPVARLRPVPSSSGNTAPRVQLLAIAACAASNGSDPSTGLWRWHLQPPTANFLGRAGWEACYAVRDAAPDALGHWHVQPGWREVEQIQHPCADGDYVWRQQKAGEVMWWFGGLHKEANNQWSPDLPRGEGVAVTRHGAVLCGTGPSACPHPGGEGWVVLELVARSEHEPHHWKLHWLQPAMHEVHTLALRAYLPMLQSWDGVGLHWYEGEPTVDGAAADTGAAPKAKGPELQTVSWSQWIDAKVEVLYEGPEGLWMRKEDMRYAENILARDDWPWKRIKTAAAAQI
ncbi:hypothetical protein [Comamonas terrigena]|uniref:hypothetical protein n=1 Tax=Comamonas terrigena TaxID=32013 RepID=UPI00289BC335|nr:hypothetical protein [Comamonas terrigena]